MIFEIFRCFLRIFHMSVHADGKRLDAADQQKRIERTEHTARGILNERELLREFLCADDCQSRDHIAVSAEIFRCAVYHNVRAERQRLLQIRRHECVIDDDEQAVRM